MEPFDANRVCDLDYYECFNRRVGGVWRAVQRGYVDVRRDTRIFIAAITCVAHVLLVSSG